MGRRFDFTMLDEKQIDEIRGWLEKSQNPVFFFDNDTDGLSSFLLLRRFIGRGKGVMIKSFPEMHASYFKRVEELKSDVIFIVDKPLVDVNFFEEARQHNIPVVWIDHHKVQQEVPEYVNYFNSMTGKKPSNEPTSYWCYRVVKQDMWIAILGIVGDWFIPDFFKEFARDYPEMVEGKKTAAALLYESKLGILIRALNFALKDSTSNVIKMIKLLQDAKDPNEIFSEEKKYGLIWKKNSQMVSKFNKYFDKAEKVAKKAGKLIVFKYSGKEKMTSEISNKLAYKYPKKMIIVAYVYGDKVSMSLRGKNIRDYLEEAFKHVEGKGGGHDNACAGQVKLDDFPKFVEEIEKQLK